MLDIIEKGGFRSPFLFDHFLLIFIVITHLKKNKMKKILMVVLVLLGLNTIQAQTSSSPYFCCDSITYWTDQSQGFNVGLDTSNIVHNPDSIEVWWAVCTNGMCYAGDGMYDYFPQVTIYDTLKVGYDVYLYENGVAEVCSREDWLVFDQNTFSWVLLNMLPTSINELQYTWEEDDNKIYDLRGRELVGVPTGVPYIKNRKIYIKK